MTDLGSFDASAINNQRASRRQPGGTQCCAGGVLTDLGPPTVRATGINDNGTIVGFARPTTGLEHGFVWQHGLVTDLGTLGGEDTTVGGINNQDQIVGMSSPAGQAPPSPEHPFLWQRRNMIDLTTVGLRADSFVGVINSKGSIGGTSGGRAALFTARSSPANLVPPRAVAGHRRHAADRSAPIGTQHDRAATPKTIST